MCYYECSTHDLWLIVTPYFSRSEMTGPSISMTSVDRFSRLIASAEMNPSLSESMSSKYCSNLLRLILSICWVFERSIGLVGQSTANSMIDSLWFFYYWNRQSPIGRLSRLRCSKIFKIGVYGTSNFGGRHILGWCSFYPFLVSYISEDSSLIFWILFSIWNDTRSRNGINDLSRQSFILGLKLKSKD